MIPNVYVDQQSCNQMHVIFKGQLSDSGAMATINGFGDLLLIQNSIRATHEIICKYVLLKPIASRAAVIRFSILWNYGWCRGKPGGLYPYPEPVYTGWSSVHWIATGMPLVDPVYTGIPLEKLSWNSSTLECHWRNLVESAPHWDATGETNFCSLHWNTTGGSVTAHTRPDTYS